MARRSQCSSAGENPLDPNYLPPHYREEYRLAIDALIDADLEGYYGFLSTFNVVDFLSQSEIEYIKCTVKEPHQTTKQDRRYVIGDGDGSSDTYWPTQSELDAPDLDLGWPQPQRFVGPTEITTLVNPPDPQMPSIKEQARRMIKNAQQVIAIVMDMFTDVDIFTDILNAAMRNVAVYVLLDEHNAHHFVAMANNCRISLDDIKFMRIRTVSGSTYFCHTGKSFKGQLMNRFMLVDCRVVLSGHYSFMWSFEKIHRCIAHVFLGHLVTTFDEEFRILYAHSEPLTAKNPVTYVDDYGNVPASEHNIENSHMYIKQYPAFANNHTEWLGHSFEDHKDVVPNMFPYRRDKASHSSTEELRPFPGSTRKQFRGEHPVLEQRKFMKVPNTKETGGLKRYGYTEIPRYVYGSPQKNAANRAIQNMEGMEIQRTLVPREEYFHPEAGPEYDMYAKSRDRSYAQYDQFSESSCHAEIADAEASGDYDHVQRYLQSYPAIEGEPVGNMLQQTAQSNPKRHSMATNYAYQGSATKPSQKEQRCSFNIHNQQEEQKEGLRDWRISSYLSAFQNMGQLDMADFQRNEPCSKVPHAIQGTPSEPDISKSRYDNTGLTKLNPLPIKQMSLTLPENTIDHTVDNVTKLANARATPPSASESSCTTEGDNREPKEPSWTHEEFFRRKPNIFLQRNSRLRHSLIFNSTLEQHSPEEERTLLGQTDEDNSSKLDHVTYNILEKKKPSTRETFKWMNLVKPSCDPSSDSTLPKDLARKRGETSVKSKDENAQVIKKVAQQEISLTSQNIQAQNRLAENSQVTQLPSLFKERAVPFVDMNDPDCRFRYFKELAAKRKAELAVKNICKEAEEEKERDSAISTVKNTNIASDSLPTASQKLLVSSLENFQDPNTKDLVLHHKYKVAFDSRKTPESVPQDGTSCSGIPATATDAEKIKLKRKLTEDCGSSSDTVQQEIATSTNKGVELKAQSKLTRQLSSIQNTSCSPFMSKKTTLPKVTGLESSTCVNPDNLKLDPVDSRAITDANTFKKHNTQESHSNLNDLLRVNVTSKNASISQDPAAAKTVSSLSNTATGKLLSKETTVAETGCSKQSAPAETGHAEHIMSCGDRTPTQTVSSLSNTATGKVPSKEISCQNFAAADNLGKYSATTETDYSLHIIAMDRDQLNTVTATDIIINQHGISTDTEALQHPTATEKCPSQHPIATNSVCSQHRNEKDTGFFQNPTATESGSSKRPTVKETDSFHYASATETGSIRDPPAADANTPQHPIETDVATLQHSSQHTTATNSASQLTETEIDSFHHPTKTETDLSELTSVPETAFCQYSFAEFGSFAVPSLADICTPQYSSETDTGTLQHPTETAACPSKCPIATKSACSQQLTVTEINISQHSYSAESTCSQQTTETETVSFHHPTPTENVSSTLPTVTETDFQHSSVIETGPVRDPFAVDIATYQHPNETDVGTLPHLTETFSSNCPTATKSPSSSQLTETEIDVTEHLNSIGTVCSLQHTAAENDSSRLLTVTVTDSFRHSSATHMGTSEHIFAEETDASQHPTETDIGTLQHPTETETCPSQHPMATKSAYSQQLTQTVIDISQHLDSPESACCQQLTETETASFHLTTETETGYSKLSTVTETVSLQSSSGSETGPSEPISAGETNNSQHCIKSEIVTLQHPNATEISTNSASPQSSPSHHLISSRTDSSQQHHVTEPGSSIFSTVTETDSLPHSSPTETGPFKHISAADKDIPQHPSETEILEHPIAAEACPPIQQLTETETASTKHSTVTEADTLQHSSATECGASTHICVAEKGTSQNSSETDIGSLQNSTATGACPSQHPVATKSACSQHATENNTETSSLLHPSAADTGSVPFSAETDTLQHPTAKEKGTSQHSTASKSTCPEHRAELKINTPQHSASTEMDCFEQFTETETSSVQNHNATETGSSKLSTLIQTDSFQHSFKHFTATERNTFEYLSATENCPSQHVITTVSACSQHLDETEPGLSQNSSQTKPPSNTPLLQSDLCQHATETGTDFYPESCLTMNCSSANLSLSVTPIDITHKEMDSATTPLLKNNILIPDDFSIRNSCNTEPTTTSLQETPNSDLNNISRQTIPAASTTLSQNNSLDIKPNETDPINCTDQKGKRAPTEPRSPKQPSLFMALVDSMLIETESCNKTESCTVTNTTETEAHASQNVEVLGSSSNENTQSDIYANSTISECHSHQTELPLISSQMHSPAASTLHPVNDGTLSLVMDSLDHSSSGVCQPVNLALKDYEIGEDITKSSSYSSSKRENDFSEIQNRELKNEDIQQQDKSIGLVSHGTERDNVDLDNNGVNKMKEITKHIENSSYGNAEQKPETCPTPRSILETQPLTVENTVPSIHRSSTANVLSCSNLRDDTKVLLEQISAKNQGKPSKLTMDDTSGNMKANKQISSLQTNTQSWSAKASHEEREKLLQRMESKRKEKKVYSRFEVP